MTESTTSTISPRSPVGQQVEDIFRQCLALYDARNTLGYRDSWRGRTGSMGVFAKIEGKTDRLYSEVWQSQGHPPDLNNAIDDALDLIMYSAFLILQLTAEANDKSRC